jgi:ABC-type lipoprotein release transport system permease subunit
VTGLVLAQVAGSYVQDVRLPGTGTIVAAALLLVAAAILASLMPAARAARVDVITALRPE